MAIEEITDARIAELISIPKEVVRGNPVPSDKGGHLQQNFDAVSADGRHFSIYTRQLKKIEDDFSCGIYWATPGGEKLTLRRYNGSSHLHPNRIEGTDTAGTDDSNSCHIHEATERYIRAGMKPEGYAEPTERYATLRDAVACLVKDCNVVGLVYEEPQMSLLDNEP